MKALICGAGIAGLTLATQLSREGWAVTLIDAAPAARDEGYMITLFGSGFDAVSRMGLLAPLRELAYDYPAIEWRTRAGESTARLTFRTIRQLLNGRLLSVMRNDLERTLIERLPPAVDFRFQRSVTHVRAPVGAVEAVLNTGEVERADVLIGADGLHSRVRDLVFGDGGSQWFRFMGFHTATFVFRDEEVHRDLNNDLCIVSVPGRQVAFFPIRDSKIAVVMAHRAPNSAPPPSAIEALNAMYGDLEGPVRRAMQAAQTEPNLHYEQVGQVVMPQWSRGRITLLGDACQAVSLLPGQGASLSMAAAFVLAQELSTKSFVKDALVAYERRVKPQMTLMRRSSRHSAEWLVPATPTGLMARNGAIRLANFPGMARMFRPAANVAGDRMLSQE